MEAGSHIGTDVSASGGGIGRRSSSGEQRGQRLKGRLREVEALRDQWEAALGSGEGAANRSAGGGGGASLVAMTADARAARSEAREAKAEAKAARGQARALEAKLAALEAKLEALASAGGETVRT